MSLEKKLDLILEHLGIEYVPEKGEKRGTRWSLREYPGHYSKMLLYCEDKLGWDEDKTYKVFMEFQDYWLSVSGQKGVKKDWLATWRNWCRKAEERNRWDKLAGENTEWEAPK